MRVQGTDRADVFHVEKEREALENWLGEYFGFSVELKQNLETGFPDDTVSPGPTIISTGTLEAIASWYPGLDVEKFVCVFALILKFQVSLPFGKIDFLQKQRRRSKFSRI